jgi:cation transport ATPase
LPEPLDPQVAHCQAFGGFEEGEVLRLAACVERESSHPLAAAIVGAAAGRGLPLDSSCESSISIPGQVRRLPSRLGRLECRLECAGTYQEAWLKQQQPTHASHLLT